MYTPFSFSPVLHQQQFNTILKSMEFPNHAPRRSQPSDNTPLIIILKYLQAPCWNTELIECAIIWKVLICFFLLRCRLISNQFKLKRGVGATARSKDIIYFKDWTFILISSFLGYQLSTCVVSEESTDQPLIMTSPVVRLKNKFQKLII